MGCENCSTLKKRVKELENRLGRLTDEYEYLKRSQADDALTIHTCDEIIDRVKKDAGDYRELYSDSRKRIKELEELLKEGK